MSRLVESSECERCGESVDGLRRLCDDCTRDVRNAREGPL
ncbi:hypothetical protein C483_15027 [Natrialba hulunbeirensis JCM 10989]|uniref:Uncharacterized protein n=1 Tax=Natrialba hulunbeirensis JCM 10989 TaxID=1227493 RepID=L9ZSZ5_9EURY|nr:hypothetical protein C483_15027 [Natrialba hulunbeirensis JCM 10989]